MEEVEVFAFHKRKPTIKKLMLLRDFKKLKPKNGYIYKAYQIGFNTTILNR